MAGDSTGSLDPLFVSHFHISSVYRVRSYEGGYQHMNEFSREGHNQGKGRVKEGGNQWQKSSMSLKSASIHSQSLQFFYFFLSQAFKKTIISPHTSSLSSSPIHTQSIHLHLSLILSLAPAHRVAHEETEHPPTLSAPQKLGSKGPRLKESWVGIE